MKKIKIEVVEHSGWWGVKVCGLRHSRYRSRIAARSREAARRPGEEAQTAGTQ